MTAEKERYESELRMAHDNQMSFLKKIFPPFPNRSEFSLYANLEPAREVGGDLYDFYLIDDNRLVFYVGDVSDKGVPASLVMGVVLNSGYCRSASPVQSGARSSWAPPARPALVTRNRELWHTEHDRGRRKLLVLCAGR